LRTREKRLQLKKLQVARLGINGHAVRFQSLRFFVVDFIDRTSGKRLALSWEKKALKFTKQGEAELAGYIEFETKKRRAWGCN